MSSTKTLFLLSLHYDPVGDHLVQPGALQLSAQAALHLLFCLRLRRCVLEYQVPGMSSLITLTCLRLLRWSARNHVQCFYTSTKFREHQLKV